MREEPSQVGWVSYKRSSSSFCPSHHVKADIRKTSKNQKVRLHQTLNLDLGFSSLLNYKIVCCCCCSHPPSLQYLVLAAPTNYNRVWCHPGRIEKKVERWRRAQVNPPKSFCLSPLGIPCSLFVSLPLSIWLSWLILNSHHVMAFGGIEFYNFSLMALKWDRLPEENI